MRITVAHQKNKQEIKRIIDQSLDDVFSGMGSLSLQIVDEKRQWDSDILRFSFGAKVMLLTTPVSGTITVTERDVTIDADLGLLEKLLPAARAKVSLESKLKGLLN